MLNSLVSTRRTMLRGGVMLGAVAMSRPLLGAEMFPVVETANGKLRGVMAADVAVFRGVRYGADTSGRNRFMPPQPVKPWTGVRNALELSPTAPSVQASRNTPYADLIMFDLQPSGPGEDMLSINIWSPDLSPNAKNPVIVVLHGGGFYGGSGNAPGMDGEAMARFGNSVVISVNHRLGAFGFLHLAEFGGRDFASSGTVGMQDIVAALRWIHTNIGNFGGDPSRVLVYGQSGGGAKTSTLLAMPSAKGLFHRAGVMSGSALTMMKPEVATRNAKVLLDALGLGKGDMRKLQDLPFTTLLETQAKLEAAARAKGEAPGSFGPVVDGIALPRDPFYPDAPAISADVPMIVSTALDERAYRMADFGMTEDGLLAFARMRAGDRGAEAVKLYRAEDPKAKPFTLAARMDSDLWFRKGAFTMAELKAAQGAAPVWTYLWTWPSPAYNGMFGAVHGIDVGPSLYSVRGGLTGSDAPARLMAKRIASAWAAFAANGDPNNVNLPEWPAYDRKNRSTMIFADDTHVEANPRAQFREFWADVPGRGRSPE